MDGGKRFDFTVKVGKGLRRAVCLGEQSAENQLPVWFCVFFKKSNCAGNVLDITEEFRTADNVILLIIRIVQRVGAEKFYALGVLLPLSARVR